MNVKVKEVLIKSAYFFEADHSRWIQGRDAKTSDGQSTFSCDPKATCFCAYGVLNKFSSRPEIYEAVTEVVFHTLGSWGLAKWNDDRDRKIEDVIKLFRDAAEKVPVDTHKIIADL